MRCKGKYKNDRMCDLCAEVNVVTHDICKQKFYELEIISIKLLKIKSICPLKRETIGDQYDFFDSCHLNKNSEGRHADRCHPKIECKRYCND